jgi:hypothetical protein
MAIKGYPESFTGGPRQILGVRVAKSRNRKQLFLLFYLLSASVFCLCRNQKAEIKAESRKIRRQKQKLKAEKSREQKICLEKSRLKSRK